MKILFASDMSFNYIEKLPSKEQAKKTMEETSKEFAKADFSILNLENIFGKKEDYKPIPKSGPNLISDDCFVEYVDALNPTAVGLANNHSRDYGDEALFHTMDMLKERGYQLCGAGANINEAYEPAVFEKDDVKVHIIAVCENEFGVATEESAGTAGYSLGKVADAIKRALLEGAEPIIYFHGGNETNPFPSPGKTELYRHFADIGARAVIAMHTHCPQGYEIYNNCPIIYSMGNFYFPKEDTDNTTWNYGYMTMLDIDTESASVEIIPYKFDYNDNHTILKGDRYHKFMDYIKEIGAPLSDAGKINELFEAWCTGVGMEAYLPFVKYTEEMYSDPRKVSPIKNIFSCEAHVELMKYTLRLIHEGRVEKAKEILPYIKSLQVIQI